MSEESNLKEIVKEKYGEIAKKSNENEGCGCCCGSSKQEVNYTVFSHDYTKLGGYLEDADLNLGCGLPTEHARMREGDTVVDLGSGAGNDCFVARSVIGDTGLVIGIDMTPEMIDKARKNVAKLGFDNVKFRLGDIENLPVTAKKADVVISNCVLNLVPDKYMAFNEIIRILKPGGHFSISDIVTSVSIPVGLREQASLYAGCVTGAVSKEEYLKIIHDTGFVNIQVQMFNSIELPEEMLRSVLSEEEYSSYIQAEIGIYSMTVYAEKPAACC